VEASVRPKDVSAATDQSLFRQRLSIASRFLFGPAATGCGILSVPLVFLFGKPVWAVFLVIVLIIRYLAGTILRRRRPRLPSDDVSDWIAIHGITTAVCLASPFLTSLFG